MRYASDLNADWRPLGSFVVLVFPRLWLLVVASVSACGRAPAGLLVAGVLIVSALVATADAQTPRGLLDDDPPTPAARPATPSAGGKSMLDEQPQGSAPISNVYDLQAWIDFDTLEAVEYDPANKTLTLFGQRGRTDRLARIPYLDHLAAAWEADAPTLSLKWTPQSRREIEEAKQDTQAFFNIFQPGSRRINALGAWLFAQGGVSVTPGTSIDEVGEQVEKKGGMAGIFKNKAPMYVPLNVVHLAFKAAPSARPEIKGMPSRSLMAKVALDADIAAKFFVEMHELKRKISGYQPYSEWERAHGDVAGEHNTWISPGKFELQESPDGRRLRFASAPMQINIQKYMAGNSTPDPVLTGYAQLLTRQYDALAVEFPVLHELREVAKIMAVRSWLKRHGWVLALPREARADWPVPDEVPGIVHMIADVSASSGSKLSVKSVLWQTGGIDLRVDNSAAVTKTNVPGYSCTSRVGTPFFGTPANPYGASLDCGSAGGPAPTVAIPPQPGPPAVPPPKSAAPVQFPVRPAPSPQGLGPISRNPIVALMVLLAPNAQAGLSKGGVPPVLAPAPRPPARKAMQDELAELKNECAAKSNKEIMENPVCRCLVHPSDPACKCRVNPKSPICKVKNPCDGTGQAWTLSPTDRGITIENGLSATEYANWSHVGATYGGTFPFLDFARRIACGREGASLKTIDTAGTTWAPRMRSHIRQLAEVILSNDFCKIKLDIRVPRGGVPATDNLVKYGKSLGVEVDVKECW
jgi:hypothetical protein